MKRALFTRSTVAASLLTLAASALGGTFAGNGGADLRPEYLTSAYFLDPKDEGRVIRVCVNSSESPAREAIARKLFEIEFAKWVDYIKTNRINERAGIPKLATRMELRESCEGDEDLTIHLGVTTPEVEDAKRLYFAPEGFAHPVDYDSARGWGKGFIYVSRDSRAYRTLDFVEQDMRNFYPSVGSFAAAREIGRSLEYGYSRVLRSDDPLPGFGAPEDLDPAVFTSFAKKRLNDSLYYANTIRDSYLGVLFLHEIGHVLGCEHVDGTIMDSRLSHFLMGNEVDLFERRRFTDEIEFARKLATCRYCTTEFKFDKTRSSEDIALFKELFGRRLGEDLSTYLRIQGTSVHIEFVDSSIQDGFTTYEKVRHWFDYNYRPTIELNGTIDIWRESRGEQSVFKTFHQGSIRADMVNSITATGRLNGARNSASFNLSWNQGERVELQITTSTRTYLLKGWITDKTREFLGINQ